MLRYISKRNSYVFALSSIFIFSFASSILFSNGLSGFNFVENKAIWAFPSNTTSRTNATLGIILPDLKQADVVFYRQLAKYLDSKEDLPHVNLILTNSTDEIVNLINRKKVDIYAASAVTSALIDNKTGAIPFLKSETKNGGDKTHSVIITKRITGYLQIFLPIDLLGKKLGFTDLSSGLEYLLPKSYLLRYGVTVNPLPQPPLNASKTSVNYVVTNGSYNTISRILDGSLGAGAISFDTYKHIPKSIKSNLKVLASTPDVPLNLVSYRPDLNSTVVDSIKRELLNINTSILFNGTYKVIFTVYDDRQGFSNLTKTAILSDLYNSCDPVQIFTVKEYC